MLSQTPQLASNIASDIDCQLDLAWLQRLHEDLGSSVEFMRLLAGDYREAAESLLSAIVSNAEAEVVSDHAHSLAGASGLLGIGTVLACAQRVEASPTPEAIEALCDVLPAAMTSLDQWVESLD